MQAEHYPPDTVFISATIPSGQTTSQEINLYGLELAGLIIPSNFDGTTIALEMSDAEGGTYVPVEDGTGTTFAISVTAGTYVPIVNLPVIAALTYIKIVAGTTQTGTDSIIKLAARNI